MSGCLVVLLLLGVIVMCTLALVFHGASWTRSVTMAFAGGVALTISVVASLTSVQGMWSIASRLYARSGPARFLKKGPGSVLSQPKPDVRFVTTEDSVTSEACRRSGGCARQASARMGPGCPCGGLLAATDQLDDGCARSAPICCC